ncbi:dynamin family protein [Venturia nashicola]|uniref:Dynamin family protein n=1 Tax=Venturia nashicola TaxID=86259 RepID=A0A4Z1P842_9PEZI|nr:dynamin family protein [Venturia nashicola]
MASRRNQSPVIKGSPSSGPAQPKDTPMQDIRPAVTPESLDGNHSQASATASSDIPIRASVPPEATRNDSLHVLGQRPKILLSAINELSAYGIDSTIPLPKIVVVGDQSAGKSSLIEAISEIKVPRDAGCCTRCPLQINLKNDESANARWVCNVVLIKKFTYTPDSEPSSNSLHPWVENSAPSSTPFGTVHSKDALEATIRRAQVATLNPQNPPHRYMSSDCIDNSIYVQFSPNIVSLEISAPNVPNLSFYDLPGVISQSRDGKKDTINLVRELVRHYVGQPNTLVLLAVPFESDIDNSKASGLLSEENANDRTIGVLTKPDRFQSDDRVEGWLEVLRGEAFAKGHGYFVVKQPSQQELKKGVTHTEARAQEADFFASEVWTSRFSGFEDRLGTSKLQEVLSEKLASLILETLPTIAERVDDRLREINEELKTLPDPPANALHVVNKALGDFVHQLRAKIDGDRPNELTKSWKGARKTFLDDITVSQRPTLLVNESLYNSTASTPNSPALTPKAVVKKQPGFTTPSKRNRTTEYVTLDDSDEEMAPTPSKRTKTSITALLRRPPPPSDRDSAVGLKVRFRLDEIRNVLDEHNASGLPGSIEPKAVDRLILSALVNWGVPLQAILKALRGALSTLLGTTLDDTLKEWHATALYKEMIRIIGTFVELHVGELESNTAARALRVEMTKPITNDVESLDRAEELELALFHTARFKERSEAYFDKTDEQTGKTTSTEARENKRRNAEQAAVIHKAIGPDPFAREVKVMSKIRAYYKIAATRFVDNICQAVEADMFLRLRNGLQDDLEEGLRVTEPDCHNYAMKLLDDDPVRADRRMRLKEQKTGLEKAALRIIQLKKDL